jgi:hypothetical protein
MKRMAITLAAAGILAGCESSVLVNNRPERTPDWNATAAASSQEQAGSQTQARSTDTPGSADEAMTAGGTVGPSTQPSREADQTVRTKHTTIESQSN